MLSQRKRGPIPKFTDSDDEKLVVLVNTMPPNSWKEISRHFRDKTAKQCRDRWNNYANPQLKHGSWTNEEDQLILDKVKEMGSAWSAIASLFDNRSPNDVRYRYVQLSKGEKQTYQDDYKKISDSPSSPECSPKEVSKEEKKEEPYNIDLMLYASFLDVNEDVFSWF